MECHWAALKLGFLGAGGLGPMAGGAGGSRCGQRVVIALKNELKGHNA
jgi:hypothetical protein